MTPLPKRRISTRRSGKRKAAIHLSLQGIAKCSNCDTFILPHRVCGTCGYYNGKPVVVKKDKKTRKDKNK